MWHAIACFSLSWQQPPGVPGRGPSRADTSAVRLAATASVQRPDSTVKTVRFRADTACVQVDMGPSALAGGGLPIVTIRVERAKGKWQALPQEMDRTHRGPLPEQTAAWRSLPAQPLDLRR